MIAALPDIVMTEAFGPIRRWRESQIEFLGTRNCGHLFLDPMIAGLPDIVMTEAFGPSRSELP